MEPREGTRHSWRGHGLGGTWEHTRHAGGTQHRGQQGSGEMCGTGGYPWHPEGDTGHPERDTARQGTRHPRGTRNCVLGTQRWHPWGTHSTWGAPIVAGTPIPLHPAAGCPVGVPGRPQPPGRGADVRRDPPISRCFHPVPAIDLLGAAGDSRGAPLGGNLQEPAPRDPPREDTLAIRGGGGSPQLSAGGSYGEPRVGRGSRGSRGSRGCCWGAGRRGVPRVAAGGSLRRFEEGLSPQLMQRRETAPGAGSAVPSCGGRAGRGQPGGAGRDRGIAWGAQPGRGRRTDPRGTRSGVRSPRLGVFPAPAATCPSRQSAHPTGCPARGRDSAGGS